MPRLIINLLKINDEKKKNKTNHLRTTKERRPYLQRNKHKNDNRLFVKNYASQKKMRMPLSVILEK